MAVFPHSKLFFPGQCGSKSTSDSHPPIPTPCPHHRPPTAGSFYTGVTSLVGGFPRVGVGGGATGSCPPPHSPTFRAVRCELLWPARGKRPENILSNGFFSADLWVVWGWSEGGLTPQGGFKSGWVGLGPEKRAPALVCWMSLRRQPPLQVPPVSPRPSSTTVGVIDPALSSSSAPQLPLGLPIKSPLHRFCRSDARRASAPSRCGVRCTPRCTAHTSPVAHVC